MVEPRIQYAKTSDGVSIAYWAMGDGPEIPLIMSPPLGWSHISYELENPELRTWYERIASKRMLVRYDQRNQGLSDRGVERLSDKDQTADIEAVIERVGVDHLHLLGFYASGRPTIRVAATQAGMVRRLVLWSISAHPVEFLSDRRMQAVRGLNETDWELFTETLSHSMLGWSSDEGHEWALFMRRAVDQKSASLLLDSMIEDDWSPWLERIPVPTLVLQDASSPSEEASNPASIPDARLVRLRDGPPVYRNEAGTRAVEEFLAEDAESHAPAAVPSGTAIILFLDIADSTALTSKLGDTAYRERERGLDAELRKAIIDAGGTPVEGKVLGDGIMAVFSSARQAIDAARACRDLGNEAGLPLHLGIHAGDVTREGNNVHGGAVQVASRVQSIAAPGEILVSQTVRDLARTSADVAFEDCGEHELKGIDEAQRLFAVRALPEATD